MQFNRIFRLTAGVQGQVGNQSSYSIANIEDIPGMLQQGNIDLANRPIVKNEDGSISTVRSESVNIDGREVLIPTVSLDGRILDDDEALEEYRRTGKHLGIFSNPDDADKYAEKLHEQQEQAYVNGSSSSGIIIEANGTDESLRITFDIDKDLTQQTNKSAISVYNLSESTRKKLEQDDLICILEAGYADDIGLRRIFIGAVTYSTTRREGADKVTELELSDGQIAIRDTVVSLGYSAGVSGDKVINDIASSMGLIVQVASDVEFSSYPSGFSFVGMGRDCLNKVCDASGATWSIQNNVLQIIMSGGSTNLRALVFSADSGLIGSPERIIKAVKRPDKEIKKKRKVKKEKHEKQAGWKITALLASTINPGDLVRVVSSTVTGWFKVESLKHSGDSRGNEWYTEMELIEVLLDE